MKRLSVTHPLSRLRAYTLIEALVASSILAIGMGAASSMSLALITQEQITERSEKAIAYLENHGPSTARTGRHLPDTHAR